jgi:hypothetical protein
MRYSVNETDGMRNTTGHGGGENYIEVREFARQLSAQGTHRDKVVRILDENQNVIAIARNGQVTTPDGRGPDVDPDKTLDPGKVE